MLSRRAQVQALEQELDRRRDDRRLLGAVGHVERAEPADRLGQARAPRASSATYSRDGVRSPVSTVKPVLERLDDAVEVVERHVPVERRVQRLGDEPLDDPLLGRLVADRLELDLADGRGDDGAQVATRAARATGSPSRTARLSAAASQHLGVGDRRPGR